MTNNKMCAYPFSSYKFILGPALSSEDAMSLEELSGSRKHLLTPPINKDRVKRPRGLWDDSNSRDVSQGERNDNQGNDRAAGTFRKQAQQPAARMLCDNSTVQLEIISTWHFRFKGNYDALSTTLRTLPYLEATLSSKV